jgi:hypothetical protein
MLRVLALPSADKAWALRELDTAASLLPRGHPSSFASRLAELHAARAALCRAPLYVVAAGEAALARGAWCAREAAQRAPRVALVASNAP